MPEIAPGGKPGNTDEISTVMSYDPYPDSVIGNAMGQDRNHCCSLILLLAFFCLLPACRSGTEPQDGQTRPDISSFLAQADQLAKSGKEAGDENRFGEAETIYLKALEIAPRDPVLLHAFAMYYIEFAEFYSERRSSDALCKKAEIFLRKAMELDPENPSYVADLASHIDTPGMGKHEEAEELYQKAIRMSPSYHYLRENLGVCYFNQEKYSEAEKTLLEYIQMEEAKNTKTDLVRAYEFLGKNYQAQGKLAEAQNALEKSAALYDGYLSNNESRDYWGCPYQSLGVLYSKIGDVAKRDRYYLKSADLQPFKYYVQTNAAVIAYRYGDHEKALHYIDRALGSRDEPEYRVVKGFILLALRRYDEAEALFSDQSRVSVSWNLSNWLARQGAIAGLGHLAIVNRDYSTAARHLNRVSGGIQGHLLKGITRLFRFDWNDPLFDPFEFYGTESFFFEMACLGMGWNYSNRNLHEQAVGWFQQALEIEPDSLVARLALANSLMGLHRIDEAEAQYDEILQQNPTNRYALAELGGIYLTRGNLDRARESYAAALNQSDGTYTCPYEGLGLVFLQTGDTAKAKNYFEKAIKLNPNIEYKKFNGLARILVQEGRIEEAKDLLEKSIHNYPQDEEASRLLASLMGNRHRSDE